MSLEYKKPEHVAFIMDGNGRWAKERNLPRVEGHRRGAEVVEDVMDMLRKFDIHYATLYAFSTENWKRSAEEVGALMSLLSFFLEKKCQKMIQNKVRLMVTGRLEGLPEKQRLQLLNVMERTAKDYEYTLILALNYGGRAEISDAAKKFASDCVAGKAKPEDMTEDLFKKYLYNPGIPDPDIMIRTAGEYRLSNFLLWELSYAEFFVSKKYWPEFDETEFERILSEFSKRDRRFGGRP